MAEVLVDVVAAARRVMSAPAARRATQSAPPKPAAADAQACPLGHQQPAGARFCADCGLPVGDTSFGPRVDLDAVRTMVQTGAMDPDAKAARDRQHTDAIAANARVERELPDLAQVADPSERKILIHFVEDGFTWKKVWLRGEMLEIGPDHPYWESAQSWITLSKQQQYQRYGRVFFDYGPYPGAVARPGTEIPLPPAPSTLWAEARGALPAVASRDNDGSLVPW